MTIAAKRAAHMGGWNKKQLYAVGITAALLVLLGAGLAFALAGSPTPEPDSTGGLVYDNSAVEGGWESMTEDEIVASLNEKLEAGMMNISMNTSPVFENGEAEGNLMIVNESVNNYPQIVELYRNDTGECIYASDAIAVGSKIERAALDVALEAGTYECTAMFHAVDPDTGATVGSAGAVITVTVNS